MNLVKIFHVNYVSLVGMLGEPLNESEADMKALHAPMLPAGMLLIWILAPGSFSMACGDEFTPNVRPMLEVSRAPGPITIDGRLGDSGWRDAARAADFAEFDPGDQLRPPVETEALLAYDDGHLYLAVICWDDPETVRATLCDRDQMRGNDVVYVELDTSGEAEWGYGLMINPYGVQGDWIWSRGGGSDWSYDLAWESAGEINGDGYLIEIALPFSSLRFPKREEQRWRINLNRIRPRGSWYQYAWAAYDRDDPCQACQWGTITGIRGVSSGKGIEILPGVIGFQAGALDDPGNPDSRFENEDPDGEMALGVTYNPTSNLTAEVTLNPDFSQVEADADQIDLNTTFALLYPEKRHFFQEGSDLFVTRLSSYYSRMINDPSLAAKVTGRTGRWSVAYAVARDEHSPVILPFEHGSACLLTGRSTANVLRLKRILGQDSSTGLMLTDRRLDPRGSGTLLGWDGDVRLHRNVRLQWHAVGTHTEEPDDPGLTQQMAWLLEEGLVDSTFDEGSHTAAPDGETYDGHALVVNLEERSRHLDFDLTYEERSPTYRAHLGYEPRNDQRMVECRSNYTLTFDDGMLERLEPSAHVGRQWNFSGERNLEWFQLGLFTQLKAQTKITATYRTDTERFRGVDFDDIWNLYGAITSSFSEPLTLGLTFQRGHQIARLQRPPVMGRQTDLSLTAYIKASDRMILQPRFSFLASRDLDTGRDLFEGTIARVLSTFQWTRNLSTRLVVQYNDIYRTWDVDPLLTYRVTPFSVLYAGSTHDYQTFDGGGPGGQDRTRLAARQVFLKVQYLFQY